MTGLRDWERDRELPAACGQPDLAPPTEAEARRLFEERLLLPGVDAPEEVTWEYARWKPGVSITTAWRLVFGDGHEELVATKRYTGSKTEALAERKDKSSAAGPFCERTRPRVLAPEDNLVLWTHPADRELPGLPLLLDHKRLASLIKHQGLTDPGLIRRRKTVRTLLRYKPERRSVYRAHFKLRDEARTRFSLALRAHPPRQAARILEARLFFEEIGGGEFTPELAGSHERYGLLLEKWLEVETPEPDGFDHAREAGATLARLHALPLPAGVPEVPWPERESLTELLALAGATPSASGALFPSTPRRTWIHGDFHPDQVARRPDGEHVLLDLDRLGAGDPAQDLANWITDHLQEDAGLDLDGAAAPLLEGYAGAGGEVPSADHLRALVKGQLESRAAASLRRLEADARGRVATLLERAAALG